MPSRRNVFRPLLLLSGYVGRALTQMVLLWACAQSAGAEGAGAFATAFAVTAPLFATVELGLRNVYQTLADTPHFRTFFSIRVSLVAVLSLALVLMSLALDSVQALALLVPVVALKAADSSLDICYAALQASGRLLRTATWMWSNSIVTLGALAVMVSRRADPGDLVWASAAVSGGALLLCAWGLWRRNVAGLAEIRRDVPRILQAGSALGLAQALASFLFYLPTLFLVLAATRAEVGVFAVGQYAVTAASLLLSSVMQTWLVPLAVASKEDGYAGIRRTGRLMVAAGALAAITTALLLPVGAPLFGSEFRIPWSTSIAFAACVFALGLDYAATTALLVLNSYRWRSVATAVGVTAGLVTAMLLTQSATVTAAAWVLAVSLSATAAASFGPIRAKINAVSQP